MFLFFPKWLVNHIKSKPIHSSASLNTWQGELGWYFHLWIQRTE